MDMIFTQLVNTQFVWYNHIQPQIMRDPIYYTYITKVKMLKFGLRYNSVSEGLHRASTFTLSSNYHFKIKAVQDKLFS